MFMSNPLPAHAAQNRSFRQFVRDQARAMSDEALTAYVNLSSGVDDDDDEAMSRDMGRVMGGMHRAVAKMDKNFRWADARRGRPAAPLPSSRPAGRG